MASVDGHECQGAELKHHISRYNQSGKNSYIIKYKSYVNVNNFFTDVIMKGVEYDVILIDIHLKPLSGFKIYDKLKEAYKVETVVLLNPDQPCDNDVSSLLNRATARVSDIVDRYKALHNNTFDNMLQIGFRAVDMGHHAVAQ